MEWMTVQHEGEEVQAANFLDGVLIRDAKHFGTTFAPGWRVEAQAGDMDGPAFRQRPKTHPVYGIELRVQE